MAKIFISYSREDLERAKALSEAIARFGHDVWWDRHIQGGSRFANEIDRALKEAGVVIVLWSESSIASAWVQDEAAEGRDTGRLVPVSLDASKPPLGFRQYQAIDLSSWSGIGDPPQLADIGRAIEQIVGVSEPAQSTKAAAASKTAKKLSICVLPFMNMSGDSEQEYFSDGISEDIITDLSKVSALSVVARNTAFTFKGQSVDVKDVARTLGVDHVLEGSVRKAGNRVRITAQLIDGAKGDHIWADRFDRDLTDIFEIQDEISKEIVKALKVKLLPGEEQAIEARGTDSADAYNLYLMARQQWIWGLWGNTRRDEAIVRITKQAVKIDPNYAEAWALMALAQAELHYWHGKDENPLPAAERALELNPALVEPRCVRIRHFDETGQIEQADQELSEVLRLNPDSWDVNRAAARLMFRRDNIAESTRYFEKAAELMDSDFHSYMMLTTCYLEIGDDERSIDAARRTLQRAEATTAKDPTNGAALAAGASSLMTLGEFDRGKDWVQRALILDPDNIMVLYNSACGLTYRNADLDGALDLLETYFERLQSPGNLHHAEIDPDLDPLRDNPRFKAMISSSRQRLGLPPAA